MSETGAYHRRQPAVVVPAELYSTVLAPFEPAAARIMRMTGTTRIRERSERSWNSCAHSLETQEPCPTNRSGPSDNLRVSGGVEPIGTGRGQHSLSGASVDTIGEAPAGGHVVAVDGDLHRVTNRFP